MFYSYIEVLVIGFFQKNLITRNKLHLNSDFFLIKKLNLYIAWDYYFN